MDKNNIKHTHTQTTHIALSILDYVQFLYNEKLLKNALKIIEIEKMKKFFCIR